MQERPGPSLSLLMAISVVTVAASPIFFPSMPTVAREFGASVSRIQLTLSSFLVLYALSMLVVGPLSDRFGRKLILMGGLLLFAAASVASACAPSSIFLIFARALQGAGACVGLVLIRAMVNDTRTREETARALSFIAIALAFTQPGASLLGGELTVLFGWRSTFLLISVLSLALVLWCHWQVPTQKSSTQSSSGNNVALFFKNYLTLVTNRRYMAYTLVISGGWAAFHCFNAAAPIILIDSYGVSPSHYGYYATAPSIGYLIGSVSVSRLSKVIGTDRMISVGCACNLLAGLLITALVASGLHHWAYTIGPTILIGLGNSLILPNSSAGSMSIFPSMAGSAAALSGFIQMTFGGLGAAATAALPPTSELRMGLIMLAASLFSIVAWVGLRSRGLETEAGPKSVSSLVSSSDPSR
jgi:DHA1 family bicyclomycin/chloramphenicol resistance-like MFS transporter